MRANVPTDNDEHVMQPVVDDASEAQKLTPEQLELAKIGNSPNWKLITKYLNGRIEVYKNGLFGEDLTAQSTEVIGQRFLAAQTVVAEFNSLIDQVETTTKSINEAVTDDAATAPVRPE